MEQLERLEKLGLLFPLARVRHPKLKRKIEYVNEGKQYRDLGWLEEGEKWLGDIKEEYMQFTFIKEFALSWLDEGFLWEPRSHPFEPWATFYDGEGEQFIESYYSFFQCHHLHRLLKAITIPFVFDWIVLADEKSVQERIDNLKERAAKALPRYQQNFAFLDEISFVCQAISSRYFAYTQSDRRTISIQMPLGWDWDKFYRNWNPKRAQNELGLNHDLLKRMHEEVRSDGLSADPMRDWYELIQFVSVEQKKKLKGDALFAQTLYSMETMLRLFARDCEGVEFPTPDEYWDWSKERKERFYGKGVTEDPFRFLEFLTTRYHLNPRPKLILVIEGNGEEEQIPRLCEAMFGCLPSKYGIEFHNLSGIGNFIGVKGRDRFGALEKFIDANHFRQTIVFLVLDREGGAEKVAQRLINARSVLYPARKLTCPGYVHLWDKCIEFDNFSDQEIAAAMTELSDDRAQFSAEEVKAAARLPMVIHLISCTIPKQIMDSISRHC